jgi:DNA-binding YbaB/EbfC family protein
MKNFSAMMKQAQELQGRMQEMQAELDTLECKGTSGAGLVTVTLNGKGYITGLSIDPSLIKPDEAEILEDLIVAAHTDAKTKMEALLQDKMKDLTGGLPIPPGMKLF